MAVQHLTKAGVVNVEKPRVGTLVACCLREALDISLEVSGVHGSQVARCNQPFPCSGPSDIYATGALTMNRDYGRPGLNQSS